MSGSIKIVDLENDAFSLSDVNGVDHGVLNLPSIFVDDSITIEEEPFVMDFTNGWNIFSLPCKIEDVTKIELIVDNNVISTDTNITKTPVYIYTKKGETTEIFQTQQTKGSDWEEEIHQSFSVAKLLSLPNSRNYILIAKDNAGNAYLPEFNYDGVGNMSKYEGFQVKTLASFQLRITSKREHRIIDGNIQFGGYVKIHEGWNIIRFPLKYSQDLALALTDVVENLLIVKNNNGNAYLPEFNFNGVGLINPGESYQCKSFNDTESIFFISENLNIIET
tara:strand:+ start:30302 stop:31135 length:834 start_codon:yes stop_codon:yes gene_type:complete